MLSMSVRVYVLCVGCVRGSTHPSCHESADVCHVCHEVCTHPFTDLCVCACVCVCVFVWVYVYMCCALGV